MTKRQQLRLRDGDNCHLCGLPMHFGVLKSNSGKIKPLGPKQATIDHIVPHSKGGSSDLSNLALAHSTCNEYRAAQHASTSIKELCRDRFLQRYASKDMRVLA